MKRLLTNFLAISAVGLLMLSSCKKNDAVVKATSGKAGLLTASATAITLVKTDTTANPVVTFNFTAASYGYAAAITNVIQIDTAGDNWAKPAVSLTLGTNVTTQSYTTKQLNTMALNQLKIAAGKTGQYNVRVVQTIGTTVTPVYSNVVTLSITPYSIVIPAVYWYVPGSYQGWTPATADSLRATNTTDTTFTGVISLTGDLNFKVVPTKASNYAGNLGDAGGGSTSNYVYTTSVSGSGGNLVGLSFPTVDPNVSITTNMITLNIAKNTIVITPDQWGVVGSATAGSWPNGSGFQDDVDMKFNNGTQTWSVVLPLSGGNQIKFRRNHDWGVNYGGDNGVIAAGGDNINITDTGTYLVTLDIVHGTYTVVKQ